MAELYEIFSELDELGHMDISEDLCLALLRDPVISSVLPSIYTSYTHFFSLHETQLAKKISWLTRNLGKCWNLFLYIPDTKK
ncbi:hypothetical protein [Methanosarcina barkeri]|uniref:hypothetical protein n=1 Tax=Methanosarcina barkeri TaxID=2208 RepID=UPI001FB2FAD8|nr:hypothetical protein [Methanosarcina barkeri]